MGNKTARKVFTPCYLQCLHYFSRMPHPITYMYLGCIVDEIQINCLNWFLFSNIIWYFGKWYCILLLVSGFLVVLHIGIPVLHNRGFIWGLGSMHSWGDVWIGRYFIAFAYYFMVNTLVQMFSMLVTSVILFSITISLNIRH